MFMWFWTKLSLGAPDKIRRILAMTFASYIRREPIYSMHVLIFGGKIIACPAADGQVTGGEKLFTNTKRFRFLVYFALFFSSLNYNELAVKGKKKHLVHRGGKGFLVIM